MTHHLSIHDARRLIVRASLLDAERPADVVEVAEQLGVIKIDPTASIMVAEHAIPFARIGWTYEPGHLYKAAYEDRVLFEFNGTYRPTSRLAALLPEMHEYPRTRSTLEWSSANKRFAAEVLSRLQHDGPLYMQDIADTSVVQQHTEGWDGLNQVPKMLNLLQRQGRVAVASRVGKKRQWDIAERVYPADLPKYSADQAKALRGESAIRAAGLARQTPSSAVGVAGEAATVEGSSRRYRVDAEALGSLDQDPGGRVALLNPYDPLLTDRTRLLEIFDFPYIVEQFKKPHERVYGYFTYPILSGDRFIGLLDAAIDRSDEPHTLRVKSIHELTPFEPEEMDMVRAEIEETARWLGVRVAGLD